MKVQVLGIGCAKCSKLYAETARAIAEAGVEADLEKVESLDEIASFGVFMTPGLVIDGQVKCVGKIPKSREIVAWLRDAE